MKSLPALLLSAAIAVLPGVVNAAGDIDADAARHLAKKSGCFKCHAIDKKKDAPSYKETATKLKGKPDAEKELYTHLTTNPKVKVDGKEERHKSPKTKDEAEIRNLVRWILSQG
jgi:cytochrome c